MQKHSLRMPSNKKFGYLFALAWSSVAAYFYWKDFQGTFIIFAVLAASILMATLFFSHLLTYINLIWFKFGLMLGKVVSPIILSIIFISLIAPIAILTRTFGRDELRLKKRKLSTYWITRDLDGNNSFPNQF